MYFLGIVLHILGFQTMKNVFDNRTVLTILDL